MSFPWEMIWAIVSKILGIPNDERQGGEGAITPGELNARSKTATISQNTTPPQGTNTEASDPCYLINLDTAYHMTTILRHAMGAKVVK
jgi:hypothetical protein